MKRDKSLSTIAFISLFFLLLYLILNNKILIYISFSTLFLVAFPTKLTDFIANYWICLGKFLGTLNSKIILTIVFFGFITPLSFLFRIFNKPTVDRFKTERKNSMFEETERVFTKDFFEKPF